MDSPGKIDGRAIFGFDIEHPDMLVAALRIPPYVGGKLLSFDEEAARKVPGVIDVVELNDEIAVLAEDAWSALRGRDALAAEWEPGDGSDFDSDEFRKNLRELCAGAGTEARREGDPETALAGAARKVEALYELPFLSHAPMETMNATASFDGETMMVEVPTQAPNWCEWIAAQGAELSTSMVELQPVLAGGGFGRRLWPDYVDAPARLSKLLKRPVKVIWSREDEFRYDYFRPASAHRMRAGLDEKGGITAFLHTLASPSISGRLNPMATASGLDEGVLLGAQNLPYAIDNLLVDLHLPSCELPIGWLRSVYDQNNAFANESFMDEIAVAAGRDPVQMRLELLKDEPRLRGVVEKVAEMSAWGRGSSTPRGFSCHHCFGSSVAMVVEMASGSEPRASSLKVERIFVAADVGTVVNPNGLRAQVEGGVAYALSGALYEDVIVKEGRVQKLNFDEYPVLRMDEMPEVIIETVDGGHPIGGIGEPPVPPTAAAVCNAWFAATGERVRRLPMMASKP